MIDIHIPGYSIERELGRGGMGVWFKVNASRAFTTQTLLRINLLISRLKGIVLLILLAMTPSSFATDAPVYSEEQIRFFDFSYSTLNYNMMWLVYHVGKPANSIVNDSRANIMTAAVGFGHGGLPGAVSAVAINQGKAAALSLLRSALENPQAVARQLASDIMERSFEAYTDNYSIYKKGVERFTPADHERFRRNLAWESMLGPAKATWNSAGQDEGSPVSESDAFRVVAAVEKILTGNALMTGSIEDLSLVIDSVMDANGALWEYSPMKPLSEAIKSLPENHHYKLIQKGDELALMPIGEAPPSTGEDAETSAPDRIVIAVIDGSGSMARNDPGGLRRHALKFLIDYLNDDTALAIVEFDHEIRILMPPARLGFLASASREAAHEAAGRLRADGGTDIPKALRAAIAQLGSDPDKGTVVFISDGIHEADEKWDGTLDFMPGGIVVHTLAFSEAADADTLSSIAASQAGVFQAVLDPAGLHSAMSDLFSLAEGQEMLVNRAGEIAVGETSEFEVLVEPGLLEILPQVSWPGSDIDMAMVGPDGSVFELTEAIDGGLGRKGATYNLMRIQRPAPGSWTLRVTGVESESGRIPFRARVATRGSRLDARWRLEPKRPVRDEPVMLSISTSEPMQWKQISVEIVTPEGRAVTETKAPGIVEAIFLGGREFPVHRFTPPESGVYRLKVDVTGTDVDGNPTARSFERSFTVFEESARRDSGGRLQPFIRR